MHQSLVPLDNTTDTKALKSRKKSWGFKRCNNECLFPSVIVIWDNPKLPFELTTQTALWPYCF